MAERPLDADAVRRAIAGDRDAQDAVWRAHRRFVAAVLLCHYPRGLDLEDGIQEVALALVRRLSTLGDPAKLRPWLRAIAVHTAASAGRRVAPAAASDVRDEAVAAARVPSDGVDARDEAEAVLRLVHELPLDYREPLVLRAMHGFSQREIAEALRLEETTVETRLVRARRALREAMERRGMAPAARAAREERRR